MNKNKNELTENLVHNLLINRLPDGYYVVSDLMLPIPGKVGYTQIDHVVVSRYGIFCIETKSHKGHIYGYFNSDNWVQYLGKQSYHFYSPKKQNDTHMLAVERALRGIAVGKCRTLIVFPWAQAVTFNTQEVKADVDALLDNILASNDPIYTDTQVNRIYEMLIRFNVLDQSVRAAHKYAVMAVHPA